MSRFLSPEALRCAPYTPGEQPRDQKYIKLNTNESPFPPSPKVLEALSRAEAEKLYLYSDPTCAALNAAIARRYGLSPENVISGNGSDEILAFAFRAFCGEGKGAAFADITYGFYEAQAALFDLEARRVPLREDFSLKVEDYLDFPGTVVLANPNAPTGMTVPASDIRRLLEKDPDRVVVVDEAYVDFGAESCVPLVREYENLLVTQTMSKSRSLAGGRIGFALGSPELIADLNRVKYSFNPYNVNRLSLLAGAAAMEDEDYFQSCCRAVRENRAWTAGALEERGFTVLPSSANFLFAKSGRLPGGELYRRLKEAGILVRWFDKDRIRDFVRVTIGSREQMEALIEQIDRLPAGGEGGKRYAHRKHSTGHPGDSNQALLEPGRHREGGNFHRLRLSGPHAGAFRPARGLRPFRCLPRRHPGGLPPLRGGCGHLPGQGVSGGFGGQAGHCPLRTVFASHGRDSGSLRL